MFSLFMRPYCPKLRHAFSLAISLLLAAPAWPATTETFVPTNINYPGSTSTAARGINNRGEIVGTYFCAAACVNSNNGETSTAGTHSFLLQNGVFTRIDVGGGTATVARGISSQGIVVGHYNVGAVTHGFACASPCQQPSDYVNPIDVPAELFDHPVSPLRDTLVIRISAQGDLVGCFHEDSQTMTTMHGWLLHEGTFTVLTTPHSAGDSSSHDPDTMNNGIASNGKIVGFYLSSGVSYIANTKNRIVTTFTFPGNLFTLAWDVNARGDTVGMYMDNQRKGHGFLRTKDAEYQSLDAQNAFSTTVFGINARGEIVGQYTDSSGAHGFVHRLNRDDRDDDEGDN